MIRHPAQVTPCQDTHGEGSDRFQLASLPPESHAALNSSRALRFPSKVAVVEEDTTEEKLQYTSSSNSSSRVAGVKRGEERSPFSSISFFLEEDGEGEGEDMRKRES